MSIDTAANFIYSTVASAPSPASSGLSLVMADDLSALMSAAPFNMFVWPTGVGPLSGNAEIVRVTNVSGATLTIVRAQEGTSARAILAGDQIAAGPTAKFRNDVVASIAAAQAAAIAASDPSGAAAAAQSASQPVSANLTAVAGLTGAADKVPFFTGTVALALADLTAAARTVLDDTTVSAMVDTLGGAAATGTGALVRKTSPALVTPNLGTPSAGNLSNCTALPRGSITGLGTNISASLAVNQDGTDSTALGYLGLPQNSKSADYTIAAADAGKTVYHPSADTTARTWTIDSNANLALPIGFTVTFVNDASAGTITIAITADTLILAGPGSTGSRTLAANGIATATKIGATRWIINGAGLT